jgi:flagellar biosynthesis protein FlhB
MITKDYSLFARVYLPITCKFLTQVIIIITITMVIIDHHRSSIIDHHHNDLVKIYGTCMHLACLFYD